MSELSACLVLRLGAPLQSWGAASQFNRRETAPAPTKSGIVGLLAAASGRRRSDPIEDLLELHLGVRTDRTGTVLRDYHTVSGLNRQALPSAQTDKRGRQRPTSPKKFTAVTQRYYLADAVFVAAVGGDAGLLTGLAKAVERPAFPMALGRRSCPPTQPLLLRPPEESAHPEHAALWQGAPEDVLENVTWQGAGRRTRGPASVSCAVTVDDEQGNDTMLDVPKSFDPLHRGMNQRRVRHSWVRLATGWSGEGYPQRQHDPFELLGG